MSTRTEHFTDLSAGAGADLPTFLRGLREFDVRLWRDGNRLRVNAPSGTLTVELREEIARRKLEILAVLSEHDAIAVTEGPHQLSFAQERLWFLDQLEGASAVYNVWIAVRLHGPLVLSALRQSLDALVQRHAVLRTTFGSVEGTPVVRITHGASAALSIIDLQLLPTTDPDALLTEIASAEVQQPFNLSDGPLFRSKLVRLSETDHALILTVHHIVCDGWSLEVLISDLATLYQTFVQDTPCTLPGLPIQFADYVAWQRGRMTGENLDGLLNYWSKQLAGAPLRLELPSDHVRAVGPGGRGERVPIRLSQSLTAAAERLGRELAATPFMVLLAGFGVLLQRYTGESDLLVGSPIAGRTRPELDGLVGLFVNTLALRLDLSGQVSFRELILRVKESALGAYAHQELPFEKLVEVLEPQRTLSQSPVVQVMFVLQNSPRASTTMRTDELVVEPLPVYTATSKFDLSLELIEIEGELRGSFEYDTRLFERTTVERMVEHLHVLLAAAIADPERPVLELPVLPDVERSLLLDEWNTTDRPYPAGVCVHELVEAQVDRTPEAIAVRCGNGQLSYAELDARANQLAHHLISQGISRGDRVVLGLDRTLDMLVALLAVSKTGAAYVPVDPAYPADRQVLMIEDSGARVMLTNDRRAAVVAPASVTLIELDSPTEQQRISAYPSTRPERRVTADDPVYVIYTSGSTGRPKGVSVPHRAVVNLLFAAQHEPGMSQQDVVLAITTLSFDIAVYDLWAPLAVGAQIVLAPPGAGSDGAFLWDLLDGSHATILQATPSTWRLLVEAGWRGTPGLKVISTGEVLPRDLAYTLVQCSRDVWNMYGPTESTVWSTYWQVTADSCGGGPVLIGRPMANTQVYVLDAHRQPAPIGIYGELYIAGDGVTHGYLGRPELTAERFVPDPFAGAGRMYRTGDLVRWRPDGMLEYLGRNDRQVKLRGFRLELGEIEAVLREHPRVHEAAATLRADRASDQRLVAYTTYGPNHAGSPTAAELRVFVADRLPNSMVPSAFVEMEVLPLTPNGKVDYQALPAPGVPETSLDGNDLAPRDDLERALVGIWEDLLGHGPIGIRSNFFEVGGHSLLAARLVFRIESSLGHKLPVSALIRAATVEQIAELIRADEKENLWKPLVALQRGDRHRRPLFLVHGAFGDVLCYTDLARELGQDQPCYVLQAIGLDGVRQPLDRVEDMARAYIEEMRSVQPHGPYCLAGYSIGGTIVFEMALQLMDAGEELALLAVFDHPPVLGLMSRRPPFPIFVARFLAHLVTNVPHWVWMARQVGRGGWNAALHERARLARRIVAGVVSGKPPTVDQMVNNLQQVNGLEYLMEWPSYRRRVLESQYQAMQSYTPRPYPGRLTLFRAQRQTLLSWHDPFLGWGAFVQGGIDVIHVPGNHNGLLRRPTVQKLATHLRSMLAATARLT